MSYNWKRLTPGTEDTDYVMLYDHTDDGHAIAHGFQDDGDLRKSIYSHVEYLVESEALAFARQLPEVRALVEAMGPMLKWAQQKPVTDKQHRQFDRAWYAARDALAPFEEAE